MPQEYGKFNLYDMPTPGVSTRQRRRKRIAPGPPGPYPGAPPLPFPSAPSQGGFSSGAPLPGRSRPRYRYDPTTGLVSEAPGEPAPPTPGRSRPRYRYDPTTGLVSEVPASETGGEEGLGGFGPFPDFETWERAFTEEHGRPPTSQDVEDAIDSFYFFEAFGRPPTQEEWEVRALTGRWGTYWRGGGGGGGGGRQPYPYSSGGASVAPWLPGLYSWRI